MDSGPEEYELNGDLSPGSPGSPGSPDASVSSFPPYRCATLAGARPLKLRAGGTSGSQASCALRSSCGAAGVAAP